MCIFCKIAEGQIPSYKIYEDDMCLAFLDLSQSNIGHTLVVPKRHFDNILELDENLAAHLFKITTILTKTIGETFNIKDFNILNNCGIVAGQTVNHFHIHIIPRILNDNIEIKLKENKISTEEFKNIQNKIIETLKKGN